MLITPFSLRSVAARLNISNDIGSDWYLVMVEVEGRGSIGVAQCSFGINTGGRISSSGVDYGC